jgi:hypothetical protein
MARGGFRCILAVVAFLAWAAVCFPCDGIKEPPKTREDVRVELTLGMARWYGLSRDQAILLLAIHDHEDGAKAKKEFGIENKEKVADPLQRYCFYGCYSARAVRRWCPDVRPETIRRFNHGFGKGKNRYPGYAEDPEWWKYVIRKMKKYQNILY